MIKSLFCQLESGEVIKRTVDSKVLHLSGDAVKCNSIISGIEKGIAEDVTGYYKEIDRHYGVVTEGLKTLNFKTDIAGVSLDANSNLSVNYITPSKYLVIRGISDDTVRLVCSPTVNLLPDDALGTSLLQYSDALSIPSWCRLVALINTFAGEAIAEFKVSERELILDESKLDTRLSTLYLILSEALRTTDGFYKLLLLSDMPSLSDKEYEALISSLANIAGVSGIIYYRNFETAVDIPEVDISL